jgi:hypothetical protein
MIERRKGAVYSRADWLKVLKETKMQEGLKLAISNREETGLKTRQELSLPVIIKIIHLLSSLHPPGKDIKERMKS